MADLQGCIELICLAMVELLENSEPEAVFAHHPDATFDLEAVGGDVAALARTVKILRRREVLDA